MVSLRVSFFAPALLICLIGCGSETAVLTPTVSIPRPTIIHEVVAIQTPYLDLFFDTLGLIDVVGTVKVAVVKIETGDIQFIDGDYSFPYYDPWRPPIP